MACQNEEIVNTVEPNETELELTVFTLSYVSKENTDLSFLLISDDNGTILYDTVGTELDLNIELEIEPELTKNVTVGSFRGEEFGFRSYLNVSSGSEVNNEFERDRHPCFKSDYTARGRAKVYITDLENYYETFNSLTNLGLGIEYYNDTLELNGAAHVRINEFNQIAIRETATSELKSILIPSNNWKLDFETQTEETTVSFKDFSSTIEHSINLYQDNRWDIIAIICDENGSLIETQNTTNTTESQEGKQIKLFLNESINVSELKLNLRASYYPTGLDYHWIQDSIPKNIYLPIDRDPIFRNYNADKFWIDNTFEYNANIVIYRYASQSTWSVTSFGGEDFGFALPRLPAKLYSEYANLDDQIKNGRFLDNYMIKTEEPIENITNLPSGLINRTSHYKPNLNYCMKKTSLQF